MTGNSDESRSRPFFINQIVRGNNIDIPIKTYLFDLYRIKKKIDNISHKQTRTLLFKLNRLLDRELGLEIMGELLENNAVIWPLFKDKYPSAGYSQFHNILRQLDPIIEGKLVNDKRVIDGHRPPKIYLLVWHEPEDFRECQKRYLEYKRHEVEAEREYRRRHRKQAIKKLREEDENQKRLREATLEWEKQKQQIIANKKSGEDQ